MLLGLLADSHDHLRHLARAVEVFRERRVEAVIHAGDYVAPFTLPVLGKVACPVYGVFGNNDGERVGLARGFAGLGEVRERPWELDLGGYRVLVLHEPFGLEGLIESRRWALVVYGHTHRLEVREGRPLIVNPGEVCGWVTGRATAALVRLPEGSVEVLELSPN